MIEIVVDDRERAGGLAESIGRVMHRAPRVARLDLGDVHIGPKLRVERKAAADFVASLAGGRLERQLAAQLAAGGRAIVIVEGEFTQQALGGMAMDVVRRTIAGIMLDLRIPVLRSRDVEETAHWIDALARHEMAGGAGSMASAALVFQPAIEPSATHGPPAGHATRRPPATSSASFAASAPASGEPMITNTRLPNVAHAELARVPGVGPRKAQMLLDHFGSLMAVRAASPDELANVQGIGPALAEAIHRRFGR